MSNEKELNTVENDGSLDLDELENVSGGAGLNPPRVAIHDYDDDVKNRV